MAKWRWQAGSQETGESEGTEPSDRPQPALQGKLWPAHSPSSGGQGDGRRQNPTRTWLPKDQGPKSLLLQEASESWDS